MNEKLKLARLKRGWSQEEAAGQARVSFRAYWNWENGLANPNFGSRRALQEAFGCAAEDLGFGKQSDEITSLAVSEAERSSLEIGFPNEPAIDWAVWFGMKLARILAEIGLWRGQASFCDEVQMMIDQEIRMIDHELQHYPPDEKQAISRRQALTTLAALPAALILGPGLLSDAAIEEFLPQCAASLTACWHLMKGKGFLSAGEILSRFVPSLSALALRPSRYQKSAASLATQASIIQGILAMHQLNFTQRELHCKEAIQYATISQNNKLQAVSLMYLAYTYSHCYYPHQPQKAIPLFHLAIQALEDKTSLLYSDILMGLSEAYAQCKEEQEALRYIGLAQESFPTYPEGDSSFIYADCGLNTLYQWTGKMYLQLADHFPDAGYQQQAAGNLLQSIGATSISDRSANETLVYRADSARLLGDLDIYAKSLRQATQMALQIGSRRRYHDALLVYERTPQAWKDEKPIKLLAKEVFKEAPATISK